MKKVNYVFIIGFILFLNLISLNSSSSFQSTNSLESASDSADDPLIFGTTSLDYDIDPVLASNIWYETSSDIADQVWEGLYAHNLGDPGLRIVPRLAADCGVWRSDGLMYDVNLRQNVSYHNGDPFNASCVVTSFERLYQLCLYTNDKIREIYFPYGFNGTKEGINDESANFGYIIKKVSALDNYKVRFALNYPYMPFQALLCFSASYIIHPDTPTHTYLDFGNINNGTAIGTGPYKATALTTEALQCEYFEDYYRGIPAIKKIIYQKFMDSERVSQAFLAGDIDIPGQYYPDYMGEFEEAEHIYVSPYREISLIRYLIMMNNVRINRIYRHAINYAIDYNKIINEIFDSEATRMRSILPPGITYRKDCMVPIFNITKSRQILIEAGYTEGYGLNEYSTDDDWKNIAESVNPIFTIKYANFLGNTLTGSLGLLIRDNLKDIGIRVDIIGKEYLILGLNLFNYFGEYDMFPISWLPDYNDPSQIINLLMSNSSSHNYAQVNDPWLQLAMEEALTLINEDDRKALYYEIQDYIATDLMPFILFTYQLTQNVRAKYVITQPNPMGKFYIFPFSWHGVNTTFNDPYLELWCSPIVLEDWPSDHISGYPMMSVSICFLVIIPIWIKIFKKRLEV